MRFWTCLVSFLVLTLVGTGCDVAETPSPAVAASEAVLEPRLLGGWRSVQNDELEGEAGVYLREDVLIRVSAFDDRQMLLEFGGQTDTECGLDCSVEPCREMTDCENPFSEALFRVLATEVAGATWVSMHPFATEAEDQGWYTGRITFRAGDTLLVEMLRDTDGAEEATTPEAVRALMTEENLSDGERFLLVPESVASATLDFVPVTEP